MKNENKIHNDICKLATELIRIQKQADEMGLFTDTRELLKCQHCKLMEDITIEGKLITYNETVILENETQEDSGLRFVVTDNPSIFLCPLCGNCVELPGIEEIEAELEGWIIGSDGVNLPKVKII